MDVIINIVEFNKIKPMSVLKNLNLCLYIKNITVYTWTHLLRKDLNCAFYQHNTD